MGYHFQTTRKAIIKKADQKTSVGEYVEKIDPSYTAGGNVKSFRCFGQV